MRYVAVWSRLFRPNAFESVEQFTEREPVLEMRPSRQFETWYLPFPVERPYTSQHRQNSPVKATRNLSRIRARSGAARRSLISREIGYGDLGSSLSGRPDSV